MAERVVTTLFLVVGFLAIEAGLLIAERRIRTAQRAYQRLLWRSSASGVEWNEWFSGGFSGTLGVRWLGTFAITSGWLILGSVFLALGFRLLSSW